MTLPALTRPAALMALLSAVACAPLLPQVEAPPALPVMAWDHVPDGPEWTEAALDALRAEGAVLLSEVPHDISAWCPNYVTAPPDQRAAFWAGIFSALARHESTWNEDAVGGGGRWFGLVQISPATARHYGCEADSSGELTEGTANIACAIRIAASTVIRDGVVAAGGDGLAADWGPFHSSRKREDMRTWVAAQSYCRAPESAS